VRLRSTADAVPPIVGTIVVLAAATGIVYALRPVAPTLSLGVVYTPAVLIVAALYGMAYGIGAAIASMLAFNFFFLAPVHTLTLADGRNWAALAVYVVSAVIASQLAAQARRRAAEAGQRERESALLADTAAELLHRDASVDEIRARSDIVLEGADERARTRFEAALAALLEVAEEREQLEEQAREAEALRRSDAVKTTIIQSVSHDFRTPLATMTAALGGLSSTEVELSSEDRAELFEALGSELARLTRLVENLLDLSRLQADAAVPHTELWDVGDLVMLAVDEVGRGSVEVHVGEDLPAARVDATQVQRALVNLIENALKFSPAGAPVSVSARESDGGLTIEVDDRGEGIRPDEAESLLEPFSRGRAAGQGAGLGLAIARGFAVANGGSLTLAAREGGGTRASLTLPAERIASEALR
jgi:two-component system, OmpR family, sensor histidine kinase KdpD